MKKLTLIIGTILILIVVGGGIYLGVTLEVETIKEKLGFDEIEEKKPQGVTIKEIVSGDNT